MTALTRAAIIDCPDLPVETVDVPEWGGPVSVRGMTAAERDIYEAAIYLQDEDAGPESYRLSRARMVAMAAVDDAGAPLFTMDDVEALAGKNGAAVSRVAAVARRLSGMGMEASEELEKNSEPGQIANSDST